MTQDPNEALASIQAARETVGRDMDYPAYWHLIYAFLLAVMVGGAGLGQPWSSLTLAVSLGGLFMMMRWWRARFGWWISARTSPRAQAVGIGLAVILMALMGLSFWTSLWGGPWWAPVVAATLAWLVGFLAGFAWMRAFKKDLAGPVR